MIESSADGRLPNVSHFKRNSASCSVTKFEFLTETGGLAPLRFNLKTKVIAIGRWPRFTFPVFRMDKPGLAPCG